MKQALTLDKAGICYYFYHNLHSLAGVFGLGKIPNRILDVLIVIYSGVAAFHKIGALYRWPEIFNPVVLRRLHESLP